MTVTKIVVVWVKKDNDLKFRHGMIHTNGMVFFIVMSSVISRVSVSQNLYVYLSYMLFLRERM